MERKKIFRSVWFWVALVVLLVAIVLPSFRGNGGYEEVPTSTALAQFADGNVSNVTINDKEQTLDLDLRARSTARTRSPRPTRPGPPPQIYDLVRGARRQRVHRPRVDFDTNVTQDNLLCRSWSASCRS